MIDLHELSKRYGATSVLDGVTFRIERGERVALLGANGAGKTTLLRAVLGLTPFEGRIEVDGVDVGRGGVRARERMGYVPQRPPVSDVSLEDFVALFAALRGTPAERVRARLSELGLSLDRDGSKALAELSGGMLQKALLGLALGAEVPALLLDEPTANLDPLAREDFLTALSRVREGTTVLLASHRISEVEAIADRILVLHEGRLAFDGSMAGLRDRVGGAGSLWIELPRKDHPSARSVLARSRPAVTVRSNGRGIWVEAPPVERGAIVGELASAGLRPGDLRTADESLMALLSRIRGAGQAGGGPPGEGAESAPGPPPHVRPGVEPTNPRRTSTEEDDHV